MATFDISLRQPTGFGIKLQDPPSGSDRVKAFDGALWPKAPTKFWNGATWEFAVVKVWDGSNWIE
jgi:hypothetical protein